MSQVTRGSLTCGYTKVYHRTEGVADESDEECRRRRAGKQNQSGLKGEEGLEINLDGETRLEGKIKKM